MVIIGYHGTLSSSAQAILHTGDFKKSCGEKEWLGPGIYFFEDTESAKAYAKKKCADACRCECSRCTFKESPSIVRAQIECANEYCFNLDNKTVVDEVEKYAKEFITQYNKEDCGSVKFNRAKARCVMLDFIGEKLGVKVFIKIFVNLHRKTSPLLFEIPMEETYICVRDQSVLKNLSIKNVLCERGGFYAV